jgi:hypothetical protein
MPGKKPLFRKNTFVAITLVQQALFNQQWLQQHVPLLHLLLPPLLLFVVVLEELRRLLLPMAFLRRQ